MIMKNKELKPQDWWSAMKASGPHKNKKKYNRKRKDQWKRYLDESDDIYTKI